MEPKYANIIDFWDPKFIQQQRTNLPTKARYIIAGYCSEAYFIDKY